jgi:hypothetical protein
MGAHQISWEKKEKNETWHLEKMEHSFFILENEHPQR